MDKSDSQKHWTAWSNYVFTFRMDSTKCSEDYPVEACTKIPGQCKVSFIMFGHCESSFELFLLKKKAITHNAGEKYLINLF